MAHEFETITTTDKAKRDALFQDLKRNGNYLERQVVKFSGSEEVPDVDVLTLTGLRKQHRSTWSVAYPTSPDVKPTRRARLRRAAEKRAA